MASMSTKKSVSRHRKYGSISSELVKKSREAAIAAVQIFNNPSMLFKSELFIVLMVIAWTYLLHAYYKKKCIDYRYVAKEGRRNQYKKTKNGAFKYWELEHCLNHQLSPVDENQKNNLLFLIGLRHEIEHQMTTRIDEYLSARFQACCINYNELAKNLFGEDSGIDKNLSFSLQFSSISNEQVELLRDAKGLPENIQSYISGFDESLSDEAYNNPRFSYRVLFVPKLANRKGQADRVIDFIKPDSALATNVNKEFVVIKESERNKYLPTQIVEIMRGHGYTKFNTHHHTKLWKENDAKNKSKGFGVQVVNTWYWYESWVNFVRDHCQKNKAKYS